MRIAFQAFTRPVWLAGIVTFQDLFTALRKLAPDRPTLELVQWENSDAADYAPLMPLVDGAIHTKYPTAPPQMPSRTRSPLESSDRLDARLRRRMARLLLPPAPTPIPAPPDETLEHRGIDVSFSVLVEHRTDVSVPLLIWIYDLQHHHLPELLSPAEGAQRDRVIRTEAARATRLIVKSSSIYNDLAGFVPEHQHKIRILPWVSNIPPEAYTCDLNALVAQYNLPEKFIYLPNQFWKHKNHLRVVEALHILQARHVEPTIVCSGTIADHRNPEYIGQVMQLVSTHNLREQFILLGAVERAHVYGLMRQSLCVLNPSQFEGYGLSAAEAKSLGKRALLADLPSLREQAIPNTRYFNPDDAHDLAAKMELVWNSTPPGPDLELEANARATLAARQLEFACAFVQIAQEAIDEFRGNPKAV